MKEHAMQLAAQCWCDPRTSHIPMDPVLAMVFSERLHAEIEEAANFARSVSYYQGLLDEIGVALGPAAYMADDGGMHDAPLRAKLPELVRKLVSILPDQPRP